MSQSCHNWRWVEQIDAFLCDSATGVLQFFANVSAPRSDNYRKVCVCLFVISNSCVLFPPSAPQFVFNSNQMEANCWTVRGASPRAHHVRAAESGSHQMWQCALKKASGLIWCIRHLLLRGWLFLCKQVPQMTHVALSFWWDGSCGRTGSTKPWRHAVGSSEMSPWGGWEVGLQSAHV